MVFPISLKGDAIYPFLGSKKNEKIKNRGFIYSNIKTNSIFIQMEIYFCKHSYNKNNKSFPNEFN